MSYSRFKLDTIHEEMYDQDLDDDLLYGDDNEQDLADGLDLDHELRLLAQVGSALTNSKGCRGTCKKFRACFGKGWDIIILVDKNACKDACRKKFGYI